MNQDGILAIAQFTFEAKDVDELGLEKVSSSMYLFSSALRNSHAHFSHSHASSKCAHFHQGDRVLVLEQNDPDWWEGKIVGGDGQIGLFPSNYVKLEEKQQ